jgi:RIO-like serine/threonine protein kinase fused to N-terminal HTH domain
LQLGETVPLVKLSIPDTGGHCYFVTSAPEATLYTPPGRATRGFKAYHISEQKVVFLKDSWRIDLPDIQAEGNVYRTLRDAEVRNVPHCLASGDISPAEYHATKTHLYVAESWACRPATHFIPHRHYRLALNIVGRVLVEYRSSYEMVTAVRDALVGEFLQCRLGYTTLNTNTITHCCLALKEAYEANILHRDFSPGNIIIDSDGHGWLIDWDLSKPVSLSTQTPRRATRTVSNDILPPVMIKANSDYGPQGTWQFMSSRLISQSNPQHNFQDDLESSLYVLLWMILMYSEVSDRDQVPPFLATVLDPQPYHQTGGFGKEDFLKGRSFLQRVKFPNRPALHQLVDRLAELFRIRYELPPSESAKAQSESLRMMLEGTDNSAIQQAYLLDPCRLYYQSMAKLQDHAATIALFDTALNNRSEWPANDFPVKQVFQPKPPTEPVLKTGWSTTLFVEELHKK